MNKKDISITDLVAEDFSAFKNDICHGFFDWFCSDKALAGKSKKLCSMVKWIADHNKKIDLSKHYVFFKNNCTGSGVKYDDFRICEMSTGKVIINVTPKSGHSGKAEIWGEVNGFETPLAEGNTWREIRKWFAE